MIDYPRSLVRLTYPQIGDEPITLNDLTIQAKIDPDAANAETGLLTIYIQAAREWIEKATGLILFPSDWKLLLDTFAFDPLPLSISPLNSVTRIDYYDLSNTLQTVDSTSYNLDLLNHPGRIQLAYGRIWPYTAIARPDAVTVYFNAGYQQSAVPQSLKLAILLLASDFYARRSDTTEMRLDTIPNGIQRLIAVNNPGIYV